MKKLTLLAAAATMIAVPANAAPNGRGDNRAKVQKVQKAQKVQNRVVQRNVNRHVTQVRNVYRQPVQVRNVYRQPVQVRNVYRTGPAVRSRSGVTIGCAASVSIAAMPTITR